MNAVQLKDIFYQINSAGLTNKSNNPILKKISKAETDNVELFYMNIEKVLIFILIFISNLFIYYLVYKNYSKKFG